jgi:hypothetical protein
VGLVEHGDTSISTSVDRLLDVLKQNPEMTFPKAASTLGVSEEVIESWVQFLEETGDVEIIYKFTTPYISLSKKRELKMQATEDVAMSKSTSIEDIMSLIDSQIEHAEKMLKGKKTQEATDHLIAVSKRIRLLIDGLREKNIPLEEVEIFSKELKLVDMALKQAEEEYKKKKQKQAQKILEDTIRKMKEGHSKTKEITKKYFEPQKAVEVPKEEEPERMMERQKFSHDELTNKIKEAMQKGDLEEANRLYAELNRLYQEELPKRFEMERENLKKSLFHISKDLTFARDSEQNSRYIKARTQILEGFNNLAKIIRDGRVADAIYSLRYIQSLFSNLPEGYEEEKKEMQARLATATKQIAELRTDTISRITKNYGEASSQLHNEFQDAVVSKDLQRAQQSYNNLKMAFQRFPSELVPEKTDAHIALLSDFQKLSGLFKDVFVEQNNARIERIGRQISILNNQIEQKSVEEAQKSYNRIQILIQEISDYYFEEKVKLQNDLIESYKNLSDIASVYYKEEFNRLSTQINARIAEGERYIASQSYELAEQTYVKALDLYTALKPGFMDKKKAIRDSLFEFYRKIMFMRDMSIIEKNSKAVYDAYSQIISLIIDAHHNIALNDVHSLPIITTQIDQAITRIPDEVWQKNPSVRKEIEKIRQETMLYKLLKQYDEKKTASADTTEIEKEIKIAIIAVAKDSPEDTNLIDFAKSILQSQQPSAPQPIHDTQAPQQIPRTVPTPVQRREQAEPVPINKPAAAPQSTSVLSSQSPQPQASMIHKEGVQGDENDGKTAEEAEDDKSSKEFEKSVSAALMLSALDDPMKDDLPDLREEIEKRNKKQKEEAAAKDNSKHAHKSKISSNIFRLKKMINPK